MLTHLQSSLGSIDLSDYQACTPSTEYHEFGYHILPIKSAKTYVLAGSSDEETRSWVNAIDANIPLRKAHTGRLAIVQDIVGALLARGIVKDIFQ